MSNFCLNNGAGDKSHKSKKSGSSREEKSTSSIKNNAIARARRAGWPRRAPGLSALTHIVGAVYGFTMAGWKMF